ncbi:hypothetical protein N7520_002400 [Penicillium odoratum]|uniref:uncharacterized protein n=1 Tax=Penicillium odoratum TaxID=1167516 RepID=UPI0025477910|nr:uncharacterized protein N7520_002400 [Penicillium odoratum]KAJ5771871.1 hypothetical protein N7520_002400 [Penicillium odoratum]
MKAFKLLLFIFLSFFNHGQASMLAAPSEMLAMYNAYVLDFLKNGATRTLAPGLPSTALEDFGTFVSNVYINQKFPRNGVFLSQTPECSKDTLGKINEYLVTDKYDIARLLRNGDTLPKGHEVMLQQLSDIVKSTRGSTASGFSDAWKIRLPEFKRALAGTQGARLNVVYYRENWGLTVTANGDPASTINEYKTWYVGLRNSNVRGAKSYISHQKITSTITLNLSELDSLDSCD